jgi:hypothetical protein
MSAKVVHVRVRAECQMSVVTFMFMHKFSYTTFSGLSSNNYFTLCNMLQKFSACFKFQFIF